MNQINKLLGDGPPTYLALPFRHTPRVTRDSLVLLCLVRAREPYRDRAGGKAGRITRERALERLARRGLIRMTRAGLWRLTLTGKRAIESREKR